MEITRRSGLSIPAKYKNELFYHDIKDFLTRRQLEYNKSTFVEYHFFVESPNSLLIPRYFPINKYLLNYKVKDILHEGEDIEITHNIKPRSEIQKEAMSFMLYNDCALMELAPGVGKTVISIHMIAERKKKTIVLVHRDKLSEQWKNRLMEFTSLKDKDIARLKSATFEKDLEKPVIISTVQTILSLVKRKTKEFLIALNNANIGVLIADEVHTTVGAPTFSECSIHIPAKVCFGLSATPDRVDGNSDIIEYHLGDIYKREDTEDTMDAKVTVVLVDYEIDTEQRVTYLRWGGSFQRSRYLNLIKKSIPFLGVVKGLLNKFKNREVICVSERIKLIEQLYKWYPGKSKGMFCGNGGLDTLNAQLTFGTPGKIRDGIDAPWKDTLVITSPISNIEQLTGRIVRKKENKNTPLVVDMVDYGCRMIANTYWKREQFYKKRNWPIQYIFYKNHRATILDESAAHQIIRGE